jgi:hypothetical protein
MVYTIITADTMEELEAETKEYFIQYHPAGYGTCVEWTRTNDAGKFERKITRWHSCD